MIKNSNSIEFVSLFTQKNPQFLRITIGINFDYFLYVLAYSVSRNCLYLSPDEVPMIDLYEQDVQ